MKSRRRRQATTREIVASSVAFENETDSSLYSVVKYLDEHLNVSENELWNIMSMQSTAANTWSECHVARTGGPGNLSIPIRFYYRIRELNFYQK
jgi:hypothetical protein